jgi:L-alanine-DL-glutamate epimerase-like enolase superfamily enzyme
MKVALMADAMGKKCTPHMTGGGLGFLYSIHFVSSLPNALKYNEFKGLGTDVVYESQTSSLKVENGMLKVPVGPGSGVIIDPDYIAKHQVIKS